MYNSKCFLWRNLCWVWKKNNTALGFLLSNCPQVLNIFYDWPVKYYFWRYSVHDYYAIGFSLVVYILYKGITSVVSCGYEVQMNMYFF